LPLSRRLCCRAVTLIGLSALAFSAHAATQTAQVNANVVKPIILTKVQDLDLGTITLGPGTWSNAAVSLTRGGTFTCGANLTCTGATQVATYNVQGSKQQPVTISAPNVTMVNQSDATQTLILTTDGPASVTLTNSGFPGVNFSIGGTIQLDSTTAPGTYVGTFNVTANY
jgi:hypothetical protein